MNKPHLWMPGWQSQGAFSKEDYNAAFGELLSTDGSVTAPQALQNFLGAPDKKRRLPPSTPTNSGKTPPALPHRTCMKTTCGIPPPERKRNFEIFARTGKSMCT